MLLPSTTTPDGIRCNTIIKRYPDGSARIMAAERAIFRIPGYESVSWKKPDADAREPPPADPEAEYARVERLGIEGDGGPTAAERAAAAASSARAQRRAKAALRDLALANAFRFFVTLTFDRQRVDRWNDREVLRVTRNWLDNRVRRDGLAYVLIPERHKDGAIHFHGFFNDALPGVDSGHRTERGQVIYNLPGWSWGFSTAIEVYGEYAGAVGYVCKYVTKGSEKVGGRWYYHGGNLRRPEVEYCRTDWTEVSEKADSKTIAALGCRICYFEAEGGE